MHAHQQRSKVRVSGLPRLCGGRHDVGPRFFLADITASLFLHEKAEVSGTLSGLRSESVADGDGISSQEFFRFHRPFPFGLNL